MWRQAASDCADSVRHTLGEERRWTSRWLDQAALIKTSAQRRSRLSWILPGLRAQSSRVATKFWLECCRPYSNAVYGFRRISQLSAATTRLWHRSPYLQLRL